MRIRRLKLAGFKSFVEPAELHIEPGLTGVVGPNGCGKSNLFEAIRWVMGEGSPKSLRGGGMEDVIFAGTSTRPARNFAEVQMLVEDAGGVHGPGEIEVVRRIERGAGSAYRLNGRDVRQKDVALLFADSATGAHSPALVSQGRIAAVIAAKPQQRREMLEEAAGIAGLHVRRKDAEQKLRATEANLVRLDEVIGDMEARANALRRQAKAAERYRQLSERIRVAEARAIFARWREAAEAADKAKKEAEAAEALVAVTAEAQRDAAALAGEAARVLADARAWAERARENALALTHKLQTLATERQTLTARLDQLAALARDLAADREREGALANDAAAALERLKDEQAALERAIVEGEAGQVAQKEALAGAERTLRDAEVALSQALAAQAAEQADARVARAAAQSAQERLRRAEAEVARVEQERAAIGDPAPHEAGRIAATEAKAKAALDSEAAREAIAVAERDREAAASAREAAETAVAAANAALSALRSERTALIRVVEGGKSSADAALSRLTVKPGYERALAAAFGDDLNASIGGSGERRWDGAAISGDPALPTGTTALADVVTAPPELARRLAQIAVVDSDDGQPLAAGQRLVTRDGVLRRWDGFRSAGEGAAAADRLIRANRLAEIDAALPAAEQAATKAQAEGAAAREAVTAAGQAAAAARTRLSQAEDAARRAAREEDAAQAAIDRIAVRRGDLAQRAERVTADLAEAKAEADRTAAALLALPDDSASRARVDALNAAARHDRQKVAALSAELAAAGERIQRARDRIANAKGEATGWRTRAGDAARRTAEMAKRIEAAEAEAARLADRPDALAAEIARVEAETANARGKSDAARADETKAEVALRQAEERAAKAGEAFATAREARAGCAARAESQEQRRVEASRLSGERFECPAVVLPEKIGFPSAEVGDAAAEQAAHDRLYSERDRLGPVNLVADTELAGLEGEATRNAAERVELGEAVNRLRGSIGSLNREGRARLLAAFEAVDGHFRRLFTTLFEGGQAHLELIDSDDPLEAGLEIMAQPPGKKLGSLTLLSGGEQALTAVALIFGLFLTNPAPICVLDEVDAPLDDANIERFCDMLDRMTRETETRYLIVTHNAVTMSRMHRLFGVTMIERGVSRLVSVDLGGAERLLAAE
ncbi:chromosome segregation protein SMC [Sphingomonas sp. ID0503]|uniref:chromosome segregation protein SMC n=1 Tax=Sphingomonas sp. ID0503 TaxID=3399691 RepID=UPI003AFB61FD